MQPTSQQARTAESSQPTLNIAAAEKEAQMVNREQIIAAALFAKQLQADLGGIKNAIVGDGIKVPQVDMTKVMPSEIYKTFRPVGAPAVPVNTQPIPVQQLPPQSPSLPPQQNLVFTYNTQEVLSQAVPAAAELAASRLDPNQLELDFNRTTRYEDVVEAIERLEKKIVIISEKIDALSLDKKKLKTDQNENGT